MLTLCLTQTAEAQSDHYRVEVVLEENGRRRELATSRFEFTLTHQDREDLRWYMEDYLENPFDPAPKIAARIEERMAAIGTQLFRAVFESSPTAQRVWARLQGGLKDTRVEVITEIREATTIPWELLRDPLTEQPLALEASAFVRSQTDVTRPARALDKSPLEEGESKIRILLVICRPRGRDDVPFRSVASRILRGLSQDARNIVQLDVLRPATFEQLAQTLRAAKRAGRPYHVVHFDGHGTYEELIPPSNEQDDPAEYARRLKEILERLNAIMLGAPRAGPHGYLLFENPRTQENMLLVDGDMLGKLLVETDVPVLVLNACQSAFADALPSPVTTEEEVGVQVRAFGSLAQEVMNAGVAGVVAMRYVLYVETAKQFVADLYGALVQGDTLGQAVSHGRKQLATNPHREIGSKPIALQDWSVPIVYEAAPIALFPRVGAIRESPLQIKLDAQARASLEGVPPPPDAGFWGRDETLLALDRAFDAQRIVLLHAYAGSGKTATAAEFARWYALTGGVQGPVLFTSFEQYRPLPRALDVIGRVFEAALEQNGFNWLALDDEQRKALTLQILGQIPVLWIWDNVEPVTGFPAGTPSAWSAAEQRELADFLRDAQGTQAKFLLTSRRDERGWLGELPARVTMPPMPMQERIQLAKALAARHGKPLTAVDDWQPLLQLTGGNPLTLTVVVGQALRDGLRTREQIQDYVDKLRAGEAVFEDEESQGRSKSLGASLSYGFASAFTEAERKQLALLHFFQGFVDVAALRQMGALKTMTGEDYSLPEVRGLTSKAGIALLDRAAEIGLLTSHGGGYYSIHPALPWYFKSMFEKYYPTPIPTPPPTSGEGRGERAATRAFVEAMGTLGVYYLRQYEAGNRDVIGLLSAEEANLLHARQIARANGWWNVVINTMSSLQPLYDHTGRRAEWKQLVDEIVPDLVDPATDGPLPGREEQWLFVSQWRRLLAEEQRRFADAEHIIFQEIAYIRKRAASALAAPPEKLDDAQRNAIRTLAVSLEQLGNIQREQSKPDCATPYQEAIPLCQHIGDKPEEAIIVFNLGCAYTDIPALRDLDKAEYWYRRDLELEDPRDRLGRGRCMGQLGLVAYEHFQEARATNQPTGQLPRLLQTAADFYHQALDLLPPNAVNDLAVAHNQLGIIYRNAGDLDRALTHYREAIRYEEMQGDLHGAAATRFNVATALAGAGCFDDALDYAQAALRNYSTFSDRAADGIQKTQQLIAEIEQAMRGKK